ncbi:DUF1593 domain-containing protein [Larkinella rosea]|uniref:DUF1593 domain-containing protein n=1 Tax=Larkinella rosea TaxID=2025312 RepID=A0A3P1BUN1_9BACT|nr:DUF1593 domain-containing protein [Larkinella rosea]RRB04818.1 DUF1593 domain-containing protein [Larkinella rosea]
MKKWRLLIPLQLLLFSPLFLLAQPEPKVRVLVLTDIEADPDDAQSLVRFLAYANEFEVEGLIATTSTHQRNRVAPETIHRILTAYGKVQPNLLKHAKGYPTAAELKTKVKKGRAVYGMEGVGGGQDSEGSEWIIKTLEKPDARPLWIPVWGGPNCLAQALWKIQKTKTAADAARLYAKLRVYTISDQDDSGPWIRKTFPGIFFIVSPGSYRNATWSGITRNFPGANNEVNSNDWIARNIQQGHGPLGTEYPDVAYGMEGDTPSFMNLIPNGLNVPEHPEYGGWGGRYELYTPKAEPRPTAAPTPVRTQGGQLVTGPVSDPETRPIWTNAEDTYSPLVASRWGRPFVTDTAKYKSSQVTLWRWREDFQHDFAARMDWMVSEYRNANHPPVPKVAHPEGLKVKSGDIFGLNATGTYDPDGDALSYYWFQYPEAGTYKERVSFAPFSPNLANLHTVKAPEVSSPQTVHFILEVTDKGSPALTRYKRVIVEVSPK